MICQSVFDPDTNELLGTVQVETRLDGEGLAAFVALLRAARRDFGMGPEERRAELERLRGPS